MRKFLKTVFYTILVLFILLNIMIAFHAYKFTHFYAGTEGTKKPEQMSAFEKAGAIFFGTNYPKSTDTISADNTFHKVVLKTDEGLNIHAWLVNTDSAKGTVILFHGHGSSSSSVLPEAMSIRKMGFNVMMVDFRAHGYSDGNTCTIGSKETEEVNLAYNYIRQRGEKNLVLWGISMGGSTVCAAVAQYDNLKPEKVIMEMPFGTLHEAATGRIKTMGLPGEPFGTLVTFWGGVEQGFWSFGFAPCEYAKSIQCPVLLQWGEHDPRVTKSEIDCIYNNLPGKKQLVTYPLAAHESLFKKEPEKWEAAVSNFLSQ